MSEGKFIVNIRAENKQIEMSKEELENIIKEQIKGMPYRDIAMNKLLSKRPSFYGGII